MDILGSVFFVDVGLQVLIVDNWTIIGIKIGIGNVSVSCCLLFCWFFFCCFF